MQAEIKDAVNKSGQDKFLISSDLESCDKRKGGRVKKRKANDAKNTKAATYVSEETGEEEGVGSIHDLISSFCLISNLFSFQESSTFETTSIILSAPPLV